jgi:hypothetical protein
MISENIINNYQQQYISEWYNYFKDSGDIPVPDDMNDYEWIEDNYGLIEDWIINTYTPTNNSDKFILFEHMRILTKILLSIDKDQYESVANLMSEKTIELMFPKDDRKTKANTYAKNYREINKHKINEKRSMYYISNKNNILGQKIVDNLNCGVTKKPRQKTIEQYNLQYDGEKWYMDNNEKKEI